MRAPTLPATGKFTKKIRKPFHVQDSGILDGAGHDPGDRAPVHAGILGRIFPLGFPVPEALGDEVVEATHTTMLGHVCPTVKALMPYPPRYPSGMAKRKPRGVIESIVGGNLDALMRHSKELSTNGKLARKIHRDFPPRTIGRIRNAETSCSLDTLTKIAKAFDIEPWHLLIPSYDPVNPPVRAMTQAERRLYASMREAAKQFEPEDINK